VWIYGIRYRDVYWMTVAAAAAAGSAALTLDPVRDAPIWRFRVNYAIDALGWASFCIAIYTFLRKSAKQTTLILIAISVTAIYMSQLLIPKDIYKSWIGNYQIRDGIVIGIILLIFAKVSSNISPDIPQRRHIQRLTLTYLLIVVGIFLILDGTFGPRLGISAMNITRTALIGAFGTFMIIDLVVFQRGYFEEKSLKEEEEKRRSALEDRMELGFSIQKLLMPNDFTKEYGPFKIHVFYECAEKMAGDWFYWKEAQNECRVVCGDVVGKGPEAAIAATSILTICNNFASVEPTMEAFLKKLNSTVAELFRKSSVSTAGGAALTQSGKATIYNHGFSGWMIIRDSKVEMIAQRGPPLGPDPDAKWEGFEIDMKKGDRLIIFSDGVAEGPRALKKVSAAIQSNYDVSLPNLAQIILETGKFSVIDDDRTLLIIEKTS
ncbi:MAG: PP2C family protein-serine/threonine phosphatase, partial [Proteobacteria bacterium]|nr:PP2C family protein-serine/threonine phosphatase [Pseudomonadota bacterium]